MGTCTEHAGTLAQQLEYQYPERGVLEIRSLDIKLERRLSGGSFLSKAVIRVGLCLAISV
jgi:hypothetical protein